MESIEDYLHRAFRIVSGSGKPKDLSKTMPHACTSHVMNSAKKETTKVVHFVMLTYLCNLLIFLFMQVSK